MYIDVLICNTMTVYIIFFLLFVCPDKFSIAERYRNIKVNFNNIPIALFLRA